MLQSFSTSKTTWNIWVHHSLNNTPTKIVILQIHPPSVKAFVKLQTNVIISLPTLKKQNKCWMFAWKPSITSSKDGYISGPKYCETLHPISKGGFRIEGDKPWLRFNSSFLFKVSQSAKLPQLPSHAWENCKYICSTNKNCSSFDYCFAKDTNDFELFNCYMKSNTFSETLLKTPRHCVKSVKQNCNIVDN